MEAAAPALMSGLAELLLRRPPSLRELVTLVGYADDYAWFAGLVRRLFPNEAEAALCGPRRTHEGGAVRQSLRRAALPPLRADDRVLDGGRGRTALVLAAEGHPLRPDGLRLRRPPRDVERLPRGPLGNGPPGQAPGRLLRRPRRAAGGLAGVGRRAHPARDPAPSPPGRHTAGGPHRGAEGNEVRGGGASLLLGPRRDRQLLPRPLLRRRSTTASATPGRTTSSPRARRSGARPAPSWTR